VAVAYIYGGGLIGLALLMAYLRPFGLLGEFGAMEFSGMGNIFKR